MKLTSSFQFNNHDKLKGLHAFMSASKYQWLRYDDEKLKSAWLNSMDAARGTELHEFAAQCIKLGQKLPKSKKTLNSYVNDAIGFMMQPEQVLYYSENCFGTTDAICFRDNFLRIHDYKSGETPAHIEQLMIYAGLFCLEYHIKPTDIQFELRIYQSDEIFVCNPEGKEIAEVCKRIVHADNLINKIKEESI